MWTTSSKPAGTFLPTVSPCCQHPAPRGLSPCWGPPCTPRGSAPHPGGRWPHHRTGLVSSGSRARKQKQTLTTPNVCSLPSFQCSGLFLPALFSAKIPEMTKNGICTADPARPRSHVLSLRWGRRPRGPGPLFQAVRGTSAHISTGHPHPEQQNRTPRAPLPPFREVFCFLRADAENPAVGAASTSGENEQPRSTLRLYSCTEVSPPRAAIPSTPPRGCPRHRATTARFQTDATLPALPPAGIRDQAGCPGSPRASRQAPSTFIARRLQETFHFFGGFIFFSFYFFFFCCQVVFPPWCGLVHGRAEELGASHSRGARWRVSLTAKVHPPTANFLSASKRSFKNKLQGGGEDDRGWHTPEGPRRSLGGAVIGSLLVLCWI